MLQKGWREEVWRNINQTWDIIVIGGGITGAGVFRQAVQEGYKTLLVEANDFAFGTSSRSSKLIHGGFRYLRNGQFSVTHESVNEREWMLKEANNLVTPLSFLMPNYTKNKTSGWELGLGVFLYDVMALKWDHKGYSKEKLLKINPYLNQDGLLGGYQYYDAQVDDSRLVFRIIQEAVNEGGTAINYAPVKKLLKTRTGDVCGVVIEDQALPKGGEYSIESKVVINATGPWTDSIRSHVNAPQRIRKLRGSHLIFPYEMIPIHQAVTLFHPDDDRAMFAFPWEGVTVIGTTDLDHPAQLEREQDEPCASEQEIEYILRGLHFTFPSIDVTRDNIISTFAGLRPIISTGKQNPSDESRAHSVWEENGLFTITGGKITTFRIMAREVLSAAIKRLPNSPNPKRSIKFFEPNEYLGTPVDLSLSGQQMTYLAGRYGNNLPELLKITLPEEIERIESLPNIWAEIKWAAHSEGVVHLDDLLLRRVRLGLLLPNAGLEHIEKIRSLAQEELGWNDAQWELEVNNYKNRWSRSYSPSPLG